MVSEDWYRSEFADQQWYRLLRVKSPQAIHSFDDEGSSKIANEAEADILQYSLLNISVQGDVMTMMQR